jgi:serine/threonine protein kinase
MNIVKQVHLGSGAYGDVYKTIDRNNGDHVVALKVMKNDNDTGEIRDSTMREFNYAQVLQHPNLVNVDPLVYNDGTRHAVFINIDKPRTELSLEMLNGDLSSLRDDVLTADVLRKMVSDITNGLYYIHSMGYIHNDLKPDNILYKLTDGVYTFKIGDLGLAQYLGIPFPDKVTSFLCTAHVKAPNSVKDSFYVEGNKYNYNSDMFSLGATMFWTCMKRHNVLWTNFKISESEVFVDIRKPNFLAQVDNLKAMFGEDGYDFLIKCMAPKSSERMSSKTALEHPYIRVLRGGAISGLFKTITELYRGPTVEDVTDSKYELEYLEDMYNGYKDNTVNLYIDYSSQTGNLNNKSSLILTSWLHEVFNHFKLESFETFLQTKLNLKMLINAKKDITTRDLQLYGLNMFRMCDKLYSNFENSHINVDNYIWVSRNLYTAERLNTNERDILRAFDCKVPFTPVMFFLNYWYLKSIYTHPHKRANLKVLTTGVAIMCAILSSNQPELADVKMDDLAKFCIRKAISIQDYTESANTLILDISDELKLNLDGYISVFIEKEYDLEYYTMIKQIILNDLDN